MKNWMKGIALIVLVALMFTSCKNSQSSTTMEDDSLALSSDMEEITFTYWSADTTAGQFDDHYASPVSKQIKALSGVTLEKEFAVGDPREKLSFMAASGEYPDFIYALEYSNIIVDAGGFIALDDLIEQYGPNIKKLYGEDLKRLRYSKEDPHIYFLGLPTVGQVRFEPETGFQLQHEAVKEAGFPDLKTLADYEAVIKNYVEKYPTIGGKPTIGMSLLAEDWRIKISVTNPAVGATGGPDDGEWYYDHESGKATLHLLREEEKEYFRWLNHMNDIGLLDPESFIQKYDQYQAKIAEGRVIGLADAKWEYVDAESALAAAGMPERTYGMYPVTLDETFVYADFRPVGYSGGYGVGISTSCEDPVAAIKFLDFMCSDEAQILARWGILGDHYEVVDGKRVFFAEVQDKLNNDPAYATESGIGIYSWPWPGYGEGALDPNGDYYSPTYKETIIDNYVPAAKEVLAAYGATMWKDLYPDETNFIKSPYGVLWQINIPTDTDAALIMARYDEITAKRIPEAVLASPAEFDAKWDAYMAELEAIDIHALEDAFNVLIKEKIELWTK